LADVLFNFQYESAGFAAVSIGLRGIYFVVSVGIFVGLIVKQRKEFKYSPMEWSREVQILLGLVFVLMIANNPFYFLVYVSSTFFQAVDAFWELIFVAYLLFFWNWSATRMRLKENESMELTRFVWVKLAMLALFLILSFTLQLLALDADEPPSLNSVIDYPKSVLVLYIIASGIFVALVTLFFWDLYQAWATSVEANVSYLLIYLATPSALVAITQLVGIVFGYVAAFNRPAPMFLFVSTIYNLYVYYLVWAFWPDKTEEGTVSAGGSERSGLLAKVEEETTKPSISSSSPKISRAFDDGNDVL
jgi:Ca2+/Na+ antiporter